MEKIGKKTAQMFSQTKGTHISLESSSSTTIPNGPVRL